MKLLLDENLSRRLVPFLQHDYPGSDQVVLLRMQSATDKESSFRPGSHALRFALMPVP